MSIRQVRSNLTPLVAQRAVWLAADDARARRAGRIAATAGGEAHRAPLAAHLAAIEHAVDELEYEAALAPLGELARLLGLNLEETA
jgi:hypothetical protein